MQIVILAGGQGTRLRPFTNDLPKPMVPINSRPFLHHLLEYIKSLEFKNILLLVGYLADKIIDYFEDGSKFGLSISYSKEDIPLGTGGALKNAQHMLDNQFLIINGDTFLPIDFQKMINRFYHNNKFSLVTVYDNHDDVFKGNIDIDDSNRVIKYSKKDSEILPYVDAGAVIMKKAILDLIPLQTKCSLEEEIFPQLINRGEVLAYRTSQIFYDMGTIEGIRKLEQVLR